MLPLQPTLTGHLVELLWGQTCSRIGNLAHVQLLGGAWGLLSTETSCSKRWKQKQSHRQNRSCTQPYRISNSRWILEHYPASAPSMFKAFLVSFVMIFAAGVSPGWRHSGNRHTMIRQRSKHRQGGPTPQWRHKCPGGQNLPVNNTFWHYSNLDTHLPYTSSGVRDLSKWLIFFHLFKRVS